MRRYLVLLCLKKSTARSCNGPSGISLGIMGCTACVALCLVQVLWCFTYSVMSASMPCQYIFSLAKCCIFSIPLWPSGKSLSILWHNSGGIHTLSPFSSIPLSMVISSLPPQNWCAMQGTSLNLLEHSLSVVDCIEYGIPFCSTSYYVDSVICKGDMLYVVV